MPRTLHLGMHLGAHPYILESLMPMTSPQPKTSRASQPAATGLSGARSYNRLAAADIPAGQRGRARSAPGGSMARAALVSTFLAGATLAAWPTPASAFCGFFVSGADAQLYNSASQVALLRNG